MSTAVSIQPVDGRERTLVFGAMFGSLAAACAIGLVCARETTVEALGAAAVAMMGVGKLLPLWGVMGHSRLGPWELGLLVWLLDTIVAVVIVYGSDALCRIRLLARVFDWVRGRARRALERHANMRRGAVAAVVLFVLVPFTGTGAIVGTFFGILLGLRRREVIGAVSAGGLLGGMGVALVASCGDAIGPADLTAAAGPAGAFAIAAALAWWLVRLHRRSRRLLRENERLSQLAHRDELTGLGNRRAFNVHLDKALARAARYGDRVSVLVADLDGLKRINDAHGHATGDRALARVGAVIATSVRGADFAARLGGDEFAVVLPSTATREAETLAERIRAGIAAIDDVAGRPLTASIGVASYGRADDEPTSATALVSRADGALYLAKHSGRNRVRISSGGAAPRA